MPPSQSLPLHTDFAIKTLMPLCHYKLALGNGGDSDDGDDDDDGGDDDGDDDDGNDDGDDNDDGADDDI